MTLVYRAVWDDDWCLPLAVLEDEFNAWCLSKGVDIEDIPYRGRFVAGDQLWIDVRRADTEIGKALRCTLIERDLRGRTWTTTATALSDNDARSFWVDLDCEDPHGGQPEMAAPRLVVGLVQGGGRPTSYGCPIQTEAIQAETTADAHDLLNELLDPGRRMPTVVFSPDGRSDRQVTIDRANAAAKTLIGLAQVYTLNRLTEATLNSTLPGGFSVFGGAVRLYLPPVHVDDPDDTHRHRWIPLRMITDHPRQAASILAGRLIRLQLHPPVPAAWSRLESLLLRPSEIDVDARATEIASSRAANDEQPMQAEIDEVTRLLAEADLILKAFEEGARRETRSLQAQVAAAEEERYDDADELEDLRRERDALQRTIRSMSRGAEADLPDQRGDPHDLDVPSSIGEAIELARQHLPFVAIPEDALRDISELDATAKYLVWGSAVWQGLLALDGYAEAKNGGQQPPGFKLWCERTGAWPTSKLAMTESSTVSTRDQYRDQRHFPVAVEVEPTGRIHMFSHLKIQVGGGQSIPRLYFHDDTDGSTGRMHVGFVGPHRHVRNTKR